MGRTSVGFKEDVVFTGGVAKNIGVRKALEDEIGMGNYSSRRAANYRCTSSFPPDSG
jgi:activator of 2-hydroxyglutaryl-CoA dehydratase